MNKLPVEITSSSHPHHFHQHTTSPSLLFILQDRFTRTLLKQPRIPQPHPLHNPQSTKSSIPTNTKIYISSIIATLTTILALTSASPSACSLKSRSPALVDVLVQSSAIGATPVQASALQVPVGSHLDLHPTLQACIGKNVRSPCQASKLTISPFGNTTDLADVECQAFKDAGAEYPATGIFTIEYPAFLSTTATRDISVVVCDFIR